MSPARAIAAVFGLFLVGIGAAADALQVTFDPGRLALGEVGWVHVRGLSQNAALTGILGDRLLTFFALGNGHAALVGVDLEERTGRHPWTVVAVERGREPRAVSGVLEVSPREFAVQHLTLPPAMVDLDTETRRRALAESERLREVYRTVTAERLWRGAFVPPVPGYLSGTGFGARRVINGKPRMPHAGIDFAAPAGTPVVAANAGRVAVVADFFFPGRLVVLDHGLALYTLYFHLARIDVAVGDRVDRGQSIGAVGATGRATGPHLHFGAQVGSARIDPAALLRLSVAD